MFDIEDGEEDFRKEGWVGDRGSHLCGAHRIGILSVLIRFGLMG